MTVRTCNVIAEVTCDAPDCRERIVGPMTRNAYDAMVHARSKAKADGWYIRRGDVQGVTYCPDHYEQGAPRPKPVRLDELPLTPQMLRVLAALRDGHPAESAGGKRIKTTVDALRARGLVTGAATLTAKGLRASGRDSRAAALDELADLLTLP